MDHKIIEFLRREGHPQTALEISKGVHKTTASDVNPTLYRLKKEKRVQQLQVGRVGSKPLWGLPQNDSSSGNQGHQPSSSPDALVPRPLSVGGRKPTAPASTVTNKASASDISSTRSTSTSTALDDLTEQMEGLSIESWKKSLNKHQLELRTGIIVKNFLPEMSQLTELERSRIDDQPGHGSQVDELIKILKTKTRKHFDKFCTVLEQENVGYNHWADKLRGGLEPPAPQGGSQPPPPAGIPKPTPPKEATPPAVATPPKEATPPLEQTDSASVPAKLGDEDVRFVLITANRNEYVSLMSFLEHPNCKLQDRVTTTCKDIVELVQPNAENDSRIKMKDSFKDFILFEVCGKSGRKFCIAVLKCLSMGSSGESGSRMETLRLLLTARDQGWKPEAVFVIGCCGGRSVPDGETAVGTVRVSSRIIHYNKGKMEEGGGITWKPTTEYNSPRTTWCVQIQKVEDEKFPQKRVAFEKLDRFLSGDHVVKSGAAAEKLSSFAVKPSAIGIEMEGLGVAEAMEIAQLINDRVIQDDGTKVPLPEYVIVKGISDLAGHDKNQPCGINFFGKQMKDVGEDHRQQMCTIMAATIVLRAIVHHT